MFLFLFYTFLFRSANALHSTLPRLPPNLETLFLFNNELDGTLPFPLPKSLKEFWINSNKFESSIEGPLPSNLTDL
jgi:hypothetical protein